MVFDVLDIHRLDGRITFKVSGKDPQELFANEHGLICWQRIPPTEKRGRIHTSTISVAILNFENASRLDEEQIRKDIVMDISRGTGSGGQKRNKTSTKVRAVHVPTGTSIVIDSRSQHQNKETAIESIIEVLRIKEKESQFSQVNSKRIEQVGRHSRGLYFRTVREREGRVLNHYNDSIVPFKKYRRGEIS